MDHDDWQAQQIANQQQADADWNTTQMISAMQRMKREDRILQLQMAIAQATDANVQARLTALLTAEEEKQERDKFHAFVAVLVMLVLLVAGGLFLLNRLGMSLGDLFGF